MADKVYSIRDLEMLSGVKAHTIRIWEKRYHLLNPLRTDTNIRFYTDSDMRRIINVAALIRRGFKISKIAGKSDRELRELLLMQMDSTGADEGDVINQMVDHMLHFDGASFSGLLESMIQSFGFSNATIRYVFPFMQKVGLFWQVGTIAPAHEHFVSHLIRRKFLVELDRPFTGPAGKTILFFLHENEMHDLSLLFYAITAKNLGFYPLYLGQNVPMDDLENLKNLSSLRYIFTVFTHSLEKSELEQLLQRISRILPGRPCLVTGHQLRHHLPHLPDGFTEIENPGEFIKILERG